jgi:hypothetical protein
MIYKYKIEKDGMVKGGSVELDVDYEYGIVKYKAAIKAGIAFFTKTYEAEGEYLCDTDLLESKHYDETQETNDVKNIRFTVMKVNGPESQVSVEFLDQNIKGVAFVNISGKYADIISLDAQAAVSGFVLSLKLRRV